ncbi:hypothetical protein ACFPRL_24975 [Pseudoclavibacter helvolus]
MLGGAELREYLVELDGRDRQAVGEVLLEGRTEVVAGGDKHGGEEASEHVGPPAGPVHDEGPEDSERREHRDGNREGRGDRELGGLADRVETGIERRAQEREREQVERGEHHGRDERHEDREHPVAALLRLNGREVIAVGRGGEPERSEGGVVVTGCG